MHSVRVCGAGDSKPQMETRERGEGERDRVTETQTEGDRHRDTETDRASAVEDVFSFRDAAVCGLRPKPRQEADTGCAAMFACPWE